LFGARNDIDQSKIKDLKEETKVAKEINQVLIEIQKKISE